MKKQLMICDVELTYRKTELPSLRIEQLSDAVPILTSMIPPGQLALREYFLMLLLNRAGRVLNRAVISIGGTSTTVVDPKVIFQTALAGAAPEIIIAHNHPSGSVQPSQLDMQLTKRIYACAELLEIRLIDHIIIPAYKNAVPAYFSFAE
jgi:DNA repair protein RadC